MRFMPHRHDARAAVHTIDMDPDLSADAAAAVIIVHPQGDVGLLTHDGVARRAQHGELAVALIMLAHDQRLHRRGQGRLAGGWRVMDFAVGDRDGARDAIRRYVRQGAGDRGEKLCAGVVAGVARIDESLAHFQRFVRGELLLQLRRDRVGLRAAIADVHALRVIHDDRGDIRQRFARFMHDQRMGEGKDQNRERQRTRPHAPRTPRESVDHQCCAKNSGHPQQPDRNIRREADGQVHRHFSVRWRSAGTCT